MDREDPTTPLAFPEYYPPGGTATLLRKDYMLYDGCTDTTKHIYIRGYVLFTKRSHDVSFSPLIILLRLISTERRHIC